MTETKLRLSKSRVSAKVRSVTPLGGGLTAMTGAQFEIRIDGTARTRPKGLRNGGGAVPQKQASAQHDNKARLALWPDTATIAESGYPEFTFEGLIGVFAPGGTPDHRRNRGGNPMFYEPDKDNHHGLPFNPYKSIVGPRPIGWISTVSRDGILKFWFLQYSFDLWVTRHLPGIRCRR